MGIFLKSFLIIAQELRQILLCHDYPLHGIGVNGRSAKILAPFRDAGGNSALSATHGFGTDADVSCGTHLAGQIYIIANDGAACQAYLSAEDAVFTYNAVMPDLNQIVDLGAFAYLC
jgi:hypothetical protein